MRIAVPVWGNSISPVLDTADRIVVFETGEDSVELCGEAFIGGYDMLGRAKIIRDCADILVCAALSRHLESCLAALGMDVRGWLMGEPEKIVEMVALGTSPGPECRMPGCRRKRGEGCGGTKRYGRRHGGTNENNGRNRA